NRAQHKKASPVAAVWRVTKTPPIELRHIVQGEGWHGEHASKGPVGNKLKDAAPRALRRYTEPVAFARLRSLAPPGTIKKPRSVARPGLELRPTAAEELTAGESDYMS